MTLLHPPINDVEELLLVQFNQFKCGGMVIVLAVHHHVGDGQCTSTFLVAWSQLVRRLAVNPMPYHGRWWQPRRCRLAFPDVGAPIWR